MCTVCMLGPWFVMILAAWDADIWADSGAKICIGALSRFERMPKTRGYCGLDNSPCAGIGLCKPSIRIEKLRRFAALV